MLSTSISCGPGPAIVQQKKHGSEINVVFFGRQDSQLWSYGWSGDRAALRYCGYIEQNMFHDHMFKALDRIANLRDPSRRSKDV